MLKSLFCSSPSKRSSGGEAHASSLVFYTVKYTGASDDSLSVPYFFLICHHVIGFELHLGCK